MRTGRTSRAIHASRHALLLAALYLFGSGHAARASGDAKDATAANALRERTGVLGIEDRTSNLAAEGADAWALEDQDNTDLAASGVALIDAPADVVLARVRDLSLLRDRGAVTAAGRVAEQLDARSFDELDVPEQTVEELGGARSGAASVKLNDSEIELLHGASPEHRVALFRRILGVRLAAWRARGVEGLGTYHDKRQPLCQAAVTRELLTQLMSLRPPRELARADTFEYWSVERLGSLKPVVALTTMATYAATDLVRVETVQIYATHYFEGLVSAFDIVPLTVGDRSATLLRVTVLARVDAAAGMLGPMKVRTGRSKLVESLKDGLAQLRASFHDATASSVCVEAQGRSAPPAEADERVSRE